VDTEIKRVPKKDILNARDWWIDGIYSTVSVVSFENAALLVRRDERAVPLLHSRVRNTNATSSVVGV
jgi:hypothetical protein